MNYHTTSLTPQKRDPYRWYARFEHFWGAAAIITILLVDPSTLHPLILAPLLLGGLVVLIIRGTAAVADLCGGDQ